MEEIITAAFLFCAPADYVAPVAVVEAYHAAYNEHDPAQMARLITIDAPINSDPTGYEVTAEIAIPAIAENVFTLGPEVRLDVLDRWVADEHVAERVRYQGHALLESTVITIYKVENGCITAIDSY